MATPAVNGMGNTRGAKRRLTEAPTPSNHVDQGVLEEIDKRRQTLSEELYTTSLELQMCRGLFEDLKGKMSRIETLLEAHTARQHKIGEEMKSLQELQEDLVHRRSTCPTNNGTDAARSRQSQAQPVIKALEQERDNGEPTGIKDHWNVTKPEDVWNDANDGLEVLELESDDGPCSSDDQPDSTPSEHDAQASDCNISPALMQFLQGLAQQPSGSQGPTGSIAPLCVPDNVECPSGHGNSLTPGTTSSTKAAASGGGRKTWKSPGIVTARRPTAKNVEKKGGGEKTSLHKIDIQELRAYARMIYTCWNKETKEFKCPICDLEATRRSAWEVFYHMLDHLGDESYFPYKCPFEDCDYTSVRSNNTQRHIEKRHGEPWTEQMKEASVNEANKSLLYEIFDAGKRVGA
ncbi:hypothetical protein AAVH_28522 [Aphelenchoides avenae]|nr:hypothetical protein AAVH_28522 [Aphelenchus avenae]